MTRSDLAAHAARLSERLGVELPASARLEEALTHSSASSGARPDNQRLEFLGDRVLGLVMAEALVGRHPNEPEGKLAPRFNDLVRKETCAEIAADLGLGDMLQLGRSEKMTGGRRKLAILGDAMEALIAAIYLDLGMDAARTAILRMWSERISRGGAAPMDAKTAIQEWAQARGLPPPSYDTIGRDGPDHAPVFTVSARLDNGAEARASAPSKRAAQQAAAAKLLESLDPDDE